MKKAKISINFETDAIKTFRYNMQFTTTSSGHLMYFHWPKTIVHRGLQSPASKNTVPPKKLISTWNDIPAKLSDPPKIKFPIHSHLEYILQKVFKMTWVKLAIYRVSLIDIYWYQSTNWFINCCLFIHSHKESLSIDLMIQPPLHYI